MWLRMTDMPDGRSGKLYRIDTFALRHQEKQDSLVCDHGFIADNG